MIFFVNTELYSTQEFHNSNFLHILLSSKFGGKLQM